MRSRQKRREVFVCCRTLHGVNNFISGEWEVPWFSVSSVSSSLVTSSPTLGVRALSSALPTGSSSGVLLGKQFSLTRYCASYSWQCCDIVFCAGTQERLDLSVGATWVNWVVVPAANYSQGKKNRCTRCYSSYYRVTVTITDNRSSSGRCLIWQLYNQLLFLIRFSLLKEKIGQLFFVVHPEVVSSERHELMMSRWCLLYQLLSDATSYASLSQPLTGARACQAQSWPVVLTDFILPRCYSAQMTNIWYRGEHEQVTGSHLHPPALCSLPGSVMRFN